MNCEMRGVQHPCVSETVVLISYVAIVWVLWMLTMMRVLHVSKCTCVLCRYGKMCFLPKLYLWNGEQGWCAFESNGCFESDFGNIIWFFVFNATIGSDIERLLCTAANPYVIVFWILFFCWFLKLGLSFCVFFSVHFSLGTHSKIFYEFKILKILLWFEKGA